jgi:hypothetical protein
MASNRQKYSASINTVADRLPLVASFDFMPCASGKLYVGYSNNGGRRGNLNSAELAVIPIESLMTAE